ncbi:MAG TPA: hypothetical protein VJ023_05250 [Pyrinomonadaceae bacterium]|nr:hypothetical protein [Pyrinomonadaceae bacterium]
MRCVNRRACQLKSLSLPINLKQTVKWAIAILLIATIPVALYERVDSKVSEAEVTVRAAGRGQPYLNLQDGRKMQVQYQGHSSLVEAMQNGGAQPRSLAAADLNGDAAPDLVAGYAYGNMGIITIQRGNTDAFAPKDDSVFARMHQGYNPDSLLPNVEVQQVPVAPEFLQIGDFNEDGRRDLLFAARGSSLYLLKGDVQDFVSEAEVVPLPGVVTALTVGEFRAADGRNDVAVGVTGPAGPEVLIFDGAAGGIAGEPLRYALNTEATAVEFGELDNDPFMDLGVAAGSEIAIVHGWGRKTSVDVSSRIERIALSFTARSIAVDNFIWDRRGAREIAALSDDGTVHLLELGGIDKRSFNAAEMSARAAMRGQLTRKNEDVEKAASWTPGGAPGWTEKNSLPLNARVSTNAASQGLLVHGKISSGETNPLLVLDNENSSLRIVREVSTKEASLSADAAVSAGELSTASLDVTDGPVAALPFTKKLNGHRDIVVLTSDQASPTIIPNAPAAVFNVTITTDPAPGACDGSCSFREAVIAANAAVGPHTINVPAGTYTLTIIGNTNSSGAGEGFSGNTAIGDVDFTRDAITVTGAGSGSTFIVQSTANDRTLEPNPLADLNFDWAISGVTIAGGRDTGGANTAGGGAMLSGSKDNITTITNCVIANNRASGDGTTGGGGISNQGGSVTITNTVIGGAVTVAGCPSQAATNCGNSSSSSGGGVAYSPGDPLGRTPSAGTLTIQTTSSFTNNTAASLTAGGGGADLYTHNLGTGSVSISSTTFTSNLATGTASGGAIIVESITTTVATTAFTSNTAANRGGGIQVAGGSLTLNGTSPSITFTNNTATVAGSSISTASDVFLSGTNTTIGGDLEITTSGVWENLPDSTMSPNNLIIIGTGSFTANNSTTNVSGNFQFQSGTFNAGTGLFNFNGTAAQTINNSVSITFNNLTNSNINQPLTINNSIVVNGTLNVNGANATLAPLAGTIISGMGTMTGTGTARVTRTAATAGFINQYTLNRTLTNLTVDYIGAAAQVLSAITYGPLKITNASGVNLAAGVSTVNGLLTLMTGALGVNTQTLIINNGTFVDSGSITSSATGTVNYAQASDGQAVRAFNYGNLTFSNFNKVLANTGTIGIAGIFTPGTAVGHTITNSTIDFNGTGAQTIPAFNYNNLTTSGARGANNITLVNGGTIGIAAAFSPTATFAGGAYVITNNTVDYNGAGAQNIAAFNYNNLTSSNVGARTLANAGTIGIAAVFTPGGNTYTITGSTINFNGAGAQSIPAFNYNNLTSSNVGGRTLPNGGTVGIAGVFTPGTNAYTITGSTINFNGSGVQTIPAFNYNNLTSSSTGARTLANSGTIGIAEIFTPGTNVYTITGSTINFNGSGAQTIPAFNFNNLTSSSTGARTLANTGTIGIAGVFTPGTNVYTITGSTVAYNGTSAQVMPATFTTYNNLTLNNAAGVTGFAGLIVQTLLRVQAGTFTSSSTYNNVQIDSGATLAGTNATTINVSGNWTNNGTFNANTGTVLFNGGALQTIGGSQPTVFHNLTIDNANGVNLGASITSGGTLALTNGALSIGGNTLSINGDITVGAGSLVGGATSNISVGGMGAGITLPAVQNGLNTLTLNRANGLTLGTSLDLINLNLTNGPLSIGATTLGINGAITVGTGSLVGGGTSNITIGGMGASTTLPGVTGGLNNLTLNRASGIVLGATLDISGVLTLTSGVITTNANTLVLRSSASVSRAAGHVFGGLEKSQVPASFTFDVGKSGANDYTPVSVANAAGGGDLTVRSVAGQQPNLVGTNFLQEYWTLTSAGTLTADLTFNYLQADVVGNESIYRIIRVNGGTVATFNNACPANPCVDIDANTAKIDGVSFFSDWTVGETIPTAANGLVTGRLTTSDGTPIEGAVVRLSGTQTRKTITDANGNYRFDNVETTGFYTVTPSRANFTFSPSARSFNQLGENTEAVFSGSAVQESVNPLETAEYFVRQQYVDLLGREPDEGGFNYWSDRILECGANADCVAARRRQVAAAFFIEQEFQLTGAFVYGLYKGPLGRHPLYSEYSVDRTQIVVGPNLDGTKQAFAEGFVSRPEFVTKYQAATDAASFVDALLQQVQNASGVDLTSQRSALIARYGAGSTLTQSRSFVLRDLTENAVFRQAEYNSAFVLTEYFGYLRRDPDLGGYEFWLNILNNREPNNYLGLVCAFITSAEYQERFGSIINRTDRECGQ